MEQSSTDRRVRKTKKQLRLALMELLAEKSAKSISVRELTERADINRGTFYIHYRDGQRRPVPGAAGSQRGHRLYQPHLLHSAGLFSV